MGEMSRSLLRCIQLMLVSMFIMQVVMVAEILLPASIPSVLMARWVVSEEKIILMAALIRHCPPRVISQSKSVSHLSRHEILVVVGWPL